MQFQFENISAFLTMSGHGPYVWACYGITWASLIYLALSPILRRKSLLLQLKRQQQIVKYKQQREPQL